MALGRRRYRQRAGRLRVRPGPQRAPARDPAAAGGRDRGDAARHQPVLDHLRVLPGARPPGRSSAGAAAADAADLRLPLLLGLLSRLHGGGGPMIPPAEAAEATAAQAARSSGGRRLRAMIQTSRPRQWPKNLLVVAAPLAGGVLDRPAVLARVALAGAAFLLASAAVYAVNDVADAERDRAHPAKRARPVASGALPPRHALALAVGCAALALGAGLASGAPLLSAAVAGYLAISFLYSTGLKHVPGVEAVLV